MARLKVDAFGGMVPVLDPRKLGAGNALSSVDIDLKATDLRTFNAIANLGIIADNNLIQRSAFVFGETQIFSWNGDVDAVFGPIHNEDEDHTKIYIGSGPAAYPQYTTRALGLPDPDDPYFGPPVLYRKLGVPAAPTPPIVSVEAADAGTITSVISEGAVIISNGDTLTDAIRFTTASPHKLQTGSTVRLSGFDWSILNNTFTVVLEIGNLDTHFFLKSLTWTEADQDRQNQDPLEPADPGVGGSYIEETVDADAEDRVYLWTLVTADGEEGPPSLPSPLVTVPLGKEVTINTGTAPEVDGVIVAKKRIYRTLPTSRGAADYYFVAEQDVQIASYVDVLAEIELGERIESLEWYPPEEGLTGFITLPNGVVLGYKNNEIWMCEPYQPHAWPEAHKKQLDHPIVGVAAFKQHVVACTDDIPYLATLTDPLSMTFAKLDTVEPCISKRCMVSLGYGVMYPSPNGLILVTAGVVRNVLADYWDEEDWRDRFFGNTWDESFAVAHDKKYYLTWYNSTSRTSETYIFDPANDRLEISKLSQSTHGGAGVDRDQDRLFFLGVQSSPNGPAVFEFDPDGGAAISGTWRSRTFVMAYPLNFGVMQVFYDDSQSGTITVKVYGDGVLRGTYTVTSQEPFRQTAGYLCREWELEIDTDIDIQSIYLAETEEELRGAFAV